MLNTINKTWSWIGVTAKEIIQTNDFGNIIFLSDNNEYYRICPEELYCGLIARNKNEYLKLSADPEFIDDWQMEKHVTHASESQGKLEEGEKYCLKLPGVLGGEYAAKNFGKISHIEQISFAGELAKQIKDLPDGSKVNFEIK